ncbi:MAG: lipoyl(octanoyl) transferase LipB [Candidatus Hydrogenedens sp.]|nr:lipoyl(octanoyl) transferase LipB [Candidatus Hydrogenedens sp.]
MSAGDGIVRIVVEPAPVPYLEMLERQKAARMAVQRGEQPHTLFLLEHPPTITCGRRSDAGHVLYSRDWLAERGVELVETDRGGDVTYHGPGQLVAYPVFDLNRMQPSVGWYIRRLEDVLIGVLADFGIPGERVEGLTGVWTGSAKIAAIGIGVRDWVTYHGIALNVDPVMEHFGYIVPCGIADKPVTSMRQVTGEAPALDTVRAALIRQFIEVFGLCAEDVIA